MAELLANAIALSTAGVDDATVLQQVVVAQQRLDGDARQEAQAEADLAGADRATQHATAAAASATQQLDHMSADVRRAVVALYTDGASPPTVRPRGGLLAAYAGDYLRSALGPYGVLSRHQDEARARISALAAAKQADQVASRARAVTSKALRDEQNELTRLQAVLATGAAASTRNLAADHLALANQAAQELSASTQLLGGPQGGVAPPPLPTTSIALSWAFAELGKSYVWGATGPDSFDCSGLTQFVWNQAGVSIPRVAADQDAWTFPVPLADLLPGDLVFFGTNDIHHVGIYIGDGLMINAPHTGDVVRVSSIWWSDLAGFGRVHSATTQVPAHQLPSDVRPAPPSVVGTTAPVPSEAAPPPQPSPPAGGGPTTSTPEVTTIATIPVTTTSAPTTTTTVPAPAPMTTTTSSTSPGPAATTTTTTTSLPSS